ARCFVLRVVCSKHVAVLRSKTQERCPVRARTLQAAAPEGPRCETKRLELEKELLDYRKSDAYLAKLKYMKLKKYLKEIEERQKKALLRNQTFLKEFIEFEAHMKTSSAEIIQKMEVQYGREIRSVLSHQGSSLSARGEEGSEQVPLVARQAGINPGTAMSRGLYHPATIFMGRQMSAISSTEDFSTQQKSFQPTKSFSFSDPYSCRQAAQSSNVTDSCVVQTNSDMQCLNKPDKKDVGTDLQMGEKMPVTSSISSENGRTHCSAIESNTNNREINLAGKPEHDPSSSKPTSSDSSSDLTVSVTEEDDVVNATEPQQRLGDTQSKVALKAVSSDQEGDTRPPGGFSLQSPNFRPAEEEPSASSVLEGDSLTLEGFSRLLQLVEDLVEMGSPRCLALYQRGSTSAAKMNQLISFCNQAGSLKEEDLEACEAVVLHQLQRLLQSTLNGGLLLETALDAQGRPIGEKQIRSEQQLDLAVLWACLSKHALFLKKHRVLLPDEVAKMFDTLLISEKKLRDAQALLLSREVLPDECEDRSSAQSQESSYSLPSILKDQGEAAAAEHAPRRPHSPGARKQEVTSWCEDESKEESVVEAIPIT
ncbi:PREDICTED: centrosomal protein kizuna, partial [Tinamus guttatus]|uniref:centrosomal protein kizuna n=1 Tax=Tinamus guttatus TaxID=94827 RepID=UPI00052E99CD